MDALELPRDFGARLHFANGGLIGDSTRQTDGSFIQLLRIAERLSSASQIRRENPCFMPYATLPQGHEVSELEGLFRHIYRKDTRANRLNVQRSFKKLKRICVKDFQLWKEPVIGIPLRTTPRVKLW